MSKGNKINTFFPFKAKPKLVLVGVLQYYGRRGDPSTPLSFDPPTRSEQVNEHFW